jgi:hypothetical protein
MGDSKWKMVTQLFGGRDFDEESMRNEDLRDTLSLTGYKVAGETLERDIMAMERERGRPGRKGYKEAARKGLKVRARG